ncbi:MAG TPA: adenosine deaminase, partial [Pseudonocardiaceae bacterium]|nr:adenosine deaminase [Pseudonocardiaceae bacterium]
LARRHPDGGVPTDPDELIRFYAFRDFPHFLDVYRLVALLVRTPDDIVALIAGLARDAAASNVRYAEVTVTALAHLYVGMPADETAAALTTGRELAAREFGVTLNWIFDIPGPTAGWAEQTTDFALNQRPAGTVALGLAGPEAEAPRSLFREHFERARAAGLHSVVHAGETTGPDEVWAAIRDLGAERIGHGIGAVSDPKLLDHLRDNDIPLEVCPTSNLCTRAVPDIDAHPLPVLLRHGVPVTLSTDDPGMFGTNLNREYELVAEAFGLGATDLVDLARTGIRAAYCDETTRMELLTSVDEVGRRHGVN